jgi:hypothetical protein
MNRGRSFPLISELPKLMDSSGWAWHKPACGSIGLGMKPEWWIGTDAKGRRWLVKMRNGFFAYREHVFASLAQRLGISCQSSAYIVIESEMAEPRLHTQGSEPYQLALWLMEEHAPHSCSAECILSDIIGKEIDFAAIERGCALGIPCFKDLVRGDVLGHLCGQHEPHDSFFTRDHEYVVIDNECVFATKSCLHECHWQDFDTAHPVIIEVCRSLSTITDQEFREMATLPEAYVISNGFDLYDLLLAARAASEEYLYLFNDASTPPCGNPRLVQSARMSSRFSEVEELVKTEREVPGTGL